jgi:hypothetical protein
MPEKLRPAGDYGLLKASTLKVNLFNVNSTCYFESDEFEF